MEGRPLAKIKKADAECQVQKLSPQRRLSIAASTLDGTVTVITCNRAVIVDTELHIRHGSALVLRGLWWIVTLQLAGEPLLGPSLLEAVGLDCQKIFSPAAERDHNEGGRADLRVEDWSDKQIVL